MSAIFPLSYSRLNVFEICNARFDYQFVSKSVQDTKHESAVVGDRVHKAIELLGKAADSADETARAKAVIALEGMPTAEVNTVVTLVQGMKKWPGEKYYEHQMAVNEHLQPVDWFAKDVMLRAIIDSLIINGETAYCFDWKTGKVRDDPSQLMLFALFVFWFFPQVQTVRTAFVWLNHNQITDATYHRQHADKMWASFKPRLEKVYETVELGVFNASPSGLCPWCPAKDICPSARTGRKRW